MNEIDQTKSTGTYNSEKTKEIADTIKDIQNDDIELIGDNIGHSAKKHGLIANFVNIGTNKKQFFAKEIDVEHGNTPAKLAIAQAFYSMIVHTPAIYGRKTIKGKDCIIYQKINIENAGHDGLRGFLNWCDKHMTTYVQMHALLYGLADGYRNTLVLKDKHRNNKLCGFDIDCNDNLFFAFNQNHLPDESKFHGDSFLNAKRSRLRIVEDECKKLANFDYDEFLHRCVMNFKILGIEKDPKTWQKFDNFLGAACDYKKELATKHFNKDRVEEKSKKWRITKLKDKILGYGDEYKAPKMVREAICKDFNNFNNFITKYEQRFEADENNNLCEKSINEIIDYYGENYRKNHPISSVKNVQSNISCNNINFVAFHSCTHYLG